MPRKPATRPPARSTRRPRDLDWSDVLADADRMRDEYQEQVRRSSHSDHAAIDRFDVGYRIVELFWFEGRGWLIVELDRHSADGSDRFMAYADQNYVLQTGCIALYGPSVREVKDAARSW